MTLPPPTPNIRLQPIEADRRTWADIMNDNLTIIDAVIAAYFVVQNLQGIWHNSTAYAAGAVVVDADTATVYRCDVAHTSPAIPTTFLESRTANPTYWSVYSSPARSRGVWTPNTAYALNDFVTSGAKYAICVQTHTSGSNFDTDQIAGKWSVLVDLSNVSSTQVPVPGGGTDANKFTVVNALGNGYTIISAAQALIALGATTVGTALFTAGSASAALNVLGGQPAGNYQPLNAYLTALTALTAAPNCFQYFDGTPTAQLATINAAGRSLLACANLAAMKVFLETTSDITAAQNTKNAVRDFGAVGDDATDNAAAFAAIQTFLTVTGGTVTFPRGIYRTSVTLSLSGNGPNVKGVGSGTNAYYFNTGPASGAYGTVFRRTGAAMNTIEITSTARTARVSGIAFWPVPFCTGGTEISDCGVYTLVEDVSFQYGYNAHLFGPGSNGSTLRSARAFAMFGPTPYRAYGSGDPLSVWAQGIAYNDVFYYNPYPGDEPTVNKVLTAWATGQVVVAGHITAANGWFWSAKNGGTTAAAGTGPDTTGLFTYAGNPTSAEFNDNGVKWQPIARANQIALDIDGSVVVFNLEHVLLHTTWYGIVIRKSDAGTTIPPQSINFNSLLVDHPVDDCVRIEYGYEIAFGKTNLRLSASGRGITFAGGTFAGGFEYLGGQVLDNALDGIEFDTGVNMRASIVGVRFARNGLKTNNTYKHISHPATTSGVQVSRCFFGGDGAPANKVSYAVAIGAGANRYDYSHNTIETGATGFIANTPGTAATRIVEKNIEY